MKGTAHVLFGVTKLTGCDAHNMGVMLTTGEVMFTTGAVTLVTWPVTLITRLYMCENGGEIPGQGAV